MKLYLADVYCAAVKPEEGSSSVRKSSNDAGSVASTLCMPSEFLKSVKTMIVEIKSPLARDRGRYAKSSVSMQLVAKSVVSSELLQIMPSVNSKQLLAAFVNH